MPTAQELLRSATGFFNCKDIGEGTLTLTIKAVANEEVGQEKEVKQVVAFKETPRKLVLNKTRLGQLAGLFSGELIGEQVELYVDKPQGLAMDIINIRAPGVADDS